MTKPNNIVPYIILTVGLLTAAGITMAIMFSDRRKAISCNAKFLFVGDSNTVIAHSYAAQLQKYCTGAKITTLAQSGRNTTTMLQTLQQNLAGGNKYDVIAILGGSNDLYAPQTVKQNLQAMYTLAKQSGARVVAVTPPSKNFIRQAQSGWGGSNYAKLLQNLQDITAWINVNTTADLIIDWNKITNRQDYFTSDMQHANATAHAVLLQQMVKKLPIESKA